MKLIQIIFAKLLVLFSIVFILLCASPVSAEKDPVPVRIGVLAKRGLERCIAKWGATADYLTKEIPGYTFSIVPLDFDDFKVLNPHCIFKIFSFVLSTRHYPEWPLVKMKFTSGELAKKVAVALLNMFSNSPAAKNAKSLGWAIPCNYQTVSESLKVIKIPPYEEYGNVTILQAIRQHWTYFIFAFMLIFVFFFFGIYALWSKRQILKSAKALAKSEEKLRNILENSTNLFYSHTPDHQITYLSPQIKNILGYTQREACRKWTELASDNPINKIGLKYTEEAIKTGKTQLPYELELIHKNGHKVYVEVREAPIVKNGKTVAIVGALADITERKNMINELHKMQKLQSIGTLAGGIAHDFNNILTVILGNITIAKIKLEKDHSSIKFLEKSEEAMDRATRLTRQLLTFSKGGEPVLENISISKLIKDIVIFDLTGSNVKPVFKFSKDLWSANVDKGQIQQVFSNITINANQAMPDGGRLYIVLENADVGKENILGINSGRYIKATVRDEGIGIDEKHIAEVFDPYFTTKQFGSGLGLATTYSIINKHSGCISVDSQISKGSTFTIYLPATSESQKSQNSKPLAIESTKIKESARILVMDDKEMILDLVTAILEGSGYSVVTVLDGSQAIEKYKESLDKGEPFDAVIMDFTIPGGLGGKDTVKEIMKIDPKAKCIVSSGYTNDAVMANYSEYGFKGIISKPFTPDKVNEELMRVLL